MLLVCASFLFFNISKEEFRMEKYCRPPLRKGEIVTVVQGLFEQALVRKKLLRHTDMTCEEATNFLQKVGPETSVMLLQLDPKDLQMACLEATFVAGQSDLERQYLN